MSRDQFGGITEQAKASRHRFDDAKSLMASSRLRGAMYIAGYAVECALKAKLMKMRGCFNLRDLQEDLRNHGEFNPADTIFTHSLEVLLLLTGARDRCQANQEVWRSFRIANRWVPAWRYATKPIDYPSDATDFVTAVETVVKWIENNI